MLLDHVWYFQKKFTADWSVVTWRTCRFGCNQKFIWYSIGWEENYCFDMRICYSFPQCQQSKPDAVIKKRQQNVTLGNGFASWILLVIQIFIIFWTQDCSWWLHQVGNSKVSQQKISPQNGSPFRIEESFPKMVLKMFDHKVLEIWSTCFAEDSSSTVNHWRETPGLRTC